MPVPSSRDREDLRARFQAWLAAKPETGGDVSVAELAVPEGTGMSSETLLVDARVGGRAERFVVRMEPERTDTPVFPTYDLHLQAAAMRLVSGHSDVPVPTVRWFEEDAALMGAPFFVMDRVDGAAPPDMPPYVFGSWLTEASPEDRARLQDQMVRVLAGVHTVDVSGPDAAFLDRPEHGDSPTAQHLGYQRWYYEWAREGVTYPIIETALDWLEANRPAERPAVLNWGDSRIGNVLWSDFTPAAVVDWEMAALGVPEVDVTWALHLHDFFHGLTVTYGMPDLLPGFLLWDDVVGRYEEVSGRTLQDLQYWLVFAALRYAIISIRTTMRAVKTGDLPEPPTPEEGLMNIDLLRSYLEGGRPR